MTTATRREQIVSEIAARVAAVVRPHPVRVAIDGVDCAGKTVFADELAAETFNGALRGRSRLRAFHYGPLFKGDIDPRTQLPRSLARSWPAG